VKKNERISSDDLHELAAMYALGSLDARERELFEQHLRECEDCAGDVLSLSQVAGLIGESFWALLSDCVNGCCPGSAAVPAFRELSWNKVGS
jgi:anti-sigma factor RsiW